MSIISTALALNTVLPASAKQFRPTQKNVPGMERTLPPQENSSLARMVQPGQVGVFACPKDNIDRKVIDTAVGEYLKGKTDVVGIQNTGTALKVPVYFLFPGIDTKDVSCEGGKKPYTRIIPLKQQRQQPTRTVTLPNLPSVVKS